jgi:hypothetical protein
LKKWLLVLGLIAYYSNCDCNNTEAVKKHGDKLKTGLAEMCLRVRPDRKAEKLGDDCGAARFALPSSLINHDGTVSPLDLLEVMLDPFNNFQQSYELTLDELGLERKDLLASLIEGRGFHAFRYQSLGSFIFTDTNATFSDAIMCDEGPILAGEASFSDLYSENLEFMGRTAICLLTSSSLTLPTLTPSAVRTLTSAPTLNLISIEAAISRV